jgi:serine/threonine-protein kinase
MSDPEAPPSNANVDSTIGRLVVEKGLATKDDVQRCLTLLQDAQAADPSGKTLSAVLVAEGLVTPRQLERLKPELEERKAGQQIPGYQILSKLGAGAMATVYKAKQVSLDRLVAIKVLPLKHTHNESFVARFYAEGKAAAKLNHPNIVQAIDVGKAGEFHYFVMEFVEGRTVYDDIVKNGRYPETEAVDIGIQVAEALAHSHDAGFIHRDVKPKNIMITESSTVKLADMGLARAVSDREAAEAEAGKAYGTPYYISPEQVRGAIDVDFRADIYSLGATLFHMVTGRVPFEGANPSAVMHKHLKTDLTPPDHLVEDLSTGISEIIEVAMAKEPKKRYATTRDMLDDLRLVANGEPPAQARKLFDLSSLSTLAPDAKHSQDIDPEPVVTGTTPLAEQPIFWLAVAGWVMAVVFLIAMIIALSA